MPDQKKSKMIDRFDKLYIKILLCLLIPILALASAHDSSQTAPVEYTYSTIDSIGLKAYVFNPKDSSDSARPAIVIFHGGGWSMGEPSWAFGRARHFAKKSMVAIAVQYRLSGSEAGFTPLDAIKDAKEAIRWTRRNARMLGIDRNKIVAYGWSAGAHLAACTAVFEDSSDRESSKPDALVLFSAALDVTNDFWFKKLLNGRAKAEDVSPHLFIDSNTPPTIILQGRTDTVTPLEGAEKFYDGIRQAGNICELHIYEGVGHLFTPSSEPDNGWPNPDKKVQTLAYKTADRFLEKLGFIKN